MFPLIIKKYYKKDDIFHSDFIYLRLSQTDLRKFSTITLLISQHHSLNGSDDRPYILHGQEKENSFTNQNFIRFVYLVEFKSKPLNFLQS
jgi:hypothetical protein